MLQKSRLVEKQVEVRDKMKVFVQKKQRKMPLVLNLPIKAFVLPGTTIIAKCGSNRLEFFLKIFHFTYMSYIYIYIYNICAEVKTSTFTNFLSCFVFKSKEFSTIFNWYIHNEYQ